jgi:hypothetical protein
VRTVGGPMEPARRLRSFIWFTWGRGTHQKGITGVGAWIPPGGLTEAKWVRGPSPLGTSFMAEGVPQGPTPSWRPWTLGRCWTNIRREQKPERPYPYGRRR